MKKSTNILRQEIASFLNSKSNPEDWDISILSESMKIFVIFHKVSDSRIFTFSVNIHNWPRSSKQNHTIGLNINRKSKIQHHAGTTIDSVSSGTSNKLT